MEPRNADRVVVKGKQVGMPDRSGTVIDVRGTAAARHCVVRWDDGHESVLFPSSDTRFERSGGQRSEADVAGNEPAAGEAEPLTIGGQVELRVEEDEEHTDAWATLHTTVGGFTGWGRARRNPVDPNLPLVGEELAIARALMSLADKLREAAGHTLDEGADPEKHLLGTA